MDEMNITSETEEEFFQDPKDLGFEDEPETDDEDENDE